MKNMPDFNPAFGKKFIVAEISEDSTIIEAIGFGDKTCHAATKPYEDALGGTVIEKKEKPPEAGASVKVSV